MLELPVAAAGGNKNPACLLQGLDHIADLHPNAQDAGHKQCRLSWPWAASVASRKTQEPGLLGQPAVVKPLTTAKYPLPAQRPSYSLLDCSATRQVLDLPAVHWRQALRQLLEAVP